MARWRSCLLLALLLLLPLNTLSDDDDGEDEGQDENDDSDDSDDGDEETPEKIERQTPRPAFMMPTAPSTMGVSITRTLARRPLECYVCSYKADAQLLKSCLDPIKYRTHTMSCHNVDDKCFTSIISKGGQYETVMRGCRSGCVNTPEVTCCEMNRCNNQAMTLPVVTQKARVTVNVSKSNKTIPPTVLFFVTILLVLQTVVKVAVV